MATAKKPSSGSDDGLDEFALDKFAKKAKKYLTLGALGFLGAGVGLRSCTIVPAGNVGVRSLLGNVKSAELDPGFNLKNPLESVIDMNTRTQEMKEQTSVPTSEGLIATLDISVLFHIDPAKADQIYRNLGTDERYLETFIRPTARSAVRDVVSNYKAEALYTSTERGKITDDLTKKLESQFAERGYLLEKVLLRDVKLPDKLVSAIEDKLKADQDAQKMSYVLAQAEKEAERKKIEAKGIADAQEVIRRSLTQQYLQWYYIETLKGLVNAPNTTFVITPYDQNLIPLLPLDPHNGSKKQ